MKTTQKKYGIVTHYMVHNHGAVLQLTALIRTLKKKGIEASALQFEKSYDFMGHAVRAKYEISIKSVGIYIKYLMSEGFRKTWYNFRKSRTLSHFKKETGIIGPYYTDAKDLNGVIIGSDEVFALHSGPTPVFCGHAAPSKKVFAYAGCFGPTTYKDVVELHCKAFVEGGLQAMCGISVRDENSREVVEKLTGISPKLVCDPVLLYGYEEEIAKMEKPIKDNYLLIYAYDGRMDTPEEVVAIKNYAKTHGLKTLSPGFYHPWVDINANVDPVNLLGYFKYASAVITDTFHGSVMSIITDASIAVRTRDSNHFKLYNLLAEYGLEDRIVTSWDKLDAVLNLPIDFNSVHEQVKVRRADSMAYLDEMIAKEV